MKKTNSARISMDLGNPRLLKLVKLDSQETGRTMREVVSEALELYFNDRLETKAINKSSESVFEEWNNPLDADYDQL